MLATGAFQYDPPTGTLPTNTPWTFTGSSGISSNNSGFTGNQPAPQGNQVAFLQQYGSFTQSVVAAHGKRDLRAHLPGRQSRQQRGGAGKL